MRVTDAHAESGATLLLVAMSLTMLMAFMALAVDAGRLWSTDRNLVTATDAAALAAASEYADGAVGCDVARSWVEANGGPVDEFSCFSVGTAATGGTVTVEAAVDVDYHFGPAIGVDQGRARSTTVARWGSSAIAGVRPLGLCQGGDAGLINWLANPSAEATLQIGFTSANAAACVLGSSGSASGNWGLLDFDGGSNSNADVRDWIENGYDGDIVLSPSLLPCSVDSTGCYEGKPGALSGSHKGALQSLVDSGVIITIPLFSSAEGNGANTQFRLSSVIRARVVDFKVTGKASKRSITLQIQPNSVIDPSGAGTGDATLGICGHRASAAFQTGCLS